MVRGVGHSVSENFVVGRKRNKDALIIIIKGPANKRQPLLFCWSYSVKKAVTIKKS